MYDTLFGAKEVNPDAQLVGNREGGRSCDMNFKLDIQTARGPISMSEVFDGKMSYCAPADICILPWPIADRHQRHSASTPRPTALLCVLPSYFTIGMVARHLLNGYTVPGTLAVGSKEAVSVSQ